MFRSINLRLWNSLKAKSEGAKAQFSHRVDGPKSKAEHSLRRKLWTRTGLAIICTAILALTIIGRLYVDYAQARQNLFDIQAFRLLLDTANHLSAERGPANVMMAAEAPADSPASKRLAEFRARSDAALDGAAAHLTMSYGLHDHPVPKHLFDRVREKLWQARMEVDRAVSIPRENRRVEDMQRAIEDMFVVVDDFQAAIAWKANALVNSDTGLAAPVLTGQMLSDLREYGGRIASQIIAPVALGEKLELKNLVDAGRTRGRILELWRLVGGQDALYHGDYRLLDGRRDVERLFLGKGLAIIDALIGEGRLSGSYSMTAEQLTISFVATLQPLERFRSAFLDLAVENVVAARDRALKILVAVAAVTALILAVLIGFVLSVQAIIFRPLLRAGEEVIGLAEDRPMALKRDPHHASEMLHLFDAIDILQGKLQERASLMGQLKLQAETDGLTNVLNRRALDQVGERRVDRQTQAGDACILILIDLDHFKSVNDTHGHLAGDDVLKEAARLMHSLVRPTDIVARFGGEEFAILISDDGLAGAVALARRIRLALQLHEIVISDGTRLHVTASFGVARGRCGQDEWRCLIDAADAALYRAKLDGRNRVRFAREAPTRPALGSASTPQDTKAENYPCAASF